MSRWSIKGEIQVRTKYKNTFRRRPPFLFLSLFLSFSGYEDVIQKLCKSAGKYDTSVFTLYRVYRHRSRRHNEAILISLGCRRRTKKNEEKRRAERTKGETSSIQTHPLTGCRKVTLSLCADYFVILFRQYVVTVPHTTSTQVQLIAKRRSGFFETSVHWTTFPAVFVISKFIK